MINKPLSVHLAPAAAINNPNEIVVINATVGSGSHLLDNSSINTSVYGASAISVDPGGQLIADSVITDKIHGNDSSISNAAPGENLIHAHQTDIVNGNQDHINFLLAPTPGASTLNQALNENESGKITGNSDNIAFVSYAGLPSLATQQAMIAKLMAENK